MRKEEVSNDHRHSKGEMLTLSYNETSAINTLAKLQYVTYSVCTCEMNLLRSPSAAFQPDILGLTEAARGVLAASKLCCYYSP